MCKCVVNISSTNQDVFASSESRRLRSSSSGMEAEDDGHGPVPMEVGAMRGEKGDKGKKGYGKGKYGKSFGKYDKSNESARTTITAKAMRKEKKKERKAKEKDKENVRGVPWSEVATVPKRKSHRGLDLNLSWNSEEDI